VARASRPWFAAPAAFDRENVNPLLLDYAAAPKPRLRLVRAIILYTLFAATGIVLGAIAGSLLLPQPSYTVSAFLTLPPGASDPQAIRAATNTLARTLNAPAARKRLTDAATTATAASNAPHTVINHFGDTLSIAPIVDTRLVRVDVTGTDPALASTYANAAAQAALTSAPLQVVAYATPPGRMTVPGALSRFASPLLGGVLFPLFCWRVTREPSNTIVSPAPVR
jgi:hypothetical protein